MPQFCYVNGRYEKNSLSSISIYDRGLQFADSIYEVILLYDNNLIDAKEHFDRLSYSLDQLNIFPPFENKIFYIIIKRLQKLNRLCSGIVYIQVTRGTECPRSHVSKGVLKPTVIVTLSPLPEPKKQGIKVITMRDPRWNRVDIKSTSLLANILAKSKAVQEGAYEAVFINDKGYITEASHSNVWIVNSEDCLQTYPSSEEILTGITRKRIMTLCGELKIKVQEKPFTYQELIKAKEIFLSSSIAQITPVNQVDNHCKDRCQDLTDPIISSYSKYIQSKVK